MTFADRLWDDEGFGIEPADANIPVVSVLLGHLQLSQEARDVQVAGIRAWLRDHTPSQSLRRSLERHGYSEALDELRASA